VKKDNDTKQAGLTGAYGEFPDHLSEKEVRKLQSIFSEFAAGFKIMVNKGPCVTVFGSSRISSVDPLYDLGRKLGRELVRSGFAVLTGGGPGLMEAVNRGAHEENGRSMGINIAMPEEQATNPYTDPSITLNHFFVRKVLLLKYSTAYIFLPGGFGTFDELFETVTLMQTKKIKNFPIVLIGQKYWSGLSDWLEKRVRKDGYIDDGDMGLLSTVDSVEEAIKLIESARAF